jgi:tripartite-type tricarboxylate transporter receptor subunit TctC
MRKHPNRSFAVLLAGLLAVVAVPALGQAWPAKNVRLVVTFPPGGGLDAHARLIAPKMSEGLGQPVIVDNRPGAGGFIGTSFVAKADPDGYTILLVPINHAIAPALYKKLPFDPIKDFVPISQTVVTTLVLVASNKSGVTSVKDLVAQAKANPGKLNFGSPSIADPLHLSMEMLRTQGNLDIVHVPYKGQAQIVTAIMSGELEFAVLSLATNLGNIRAGTMKALGVTSARRSAAAQEIPTIAESGFPDYEATSWLGLFAPAGTPREVVQRIQRETVKAMAAPEVRERLLAQGQEIVGSTPEEFDAKVKADVAKFIRLAKEAKIPFQD